MSFDGLSVMKLTLFPQYIKLIKKKNMLSQEDTSEKRNPNYKFALTPHIILGNKLINKFQVLF